MWDESVADQTSNDGAGSVAHAIDDIVLVAYLLVTLSSSICRGLYRRQHPQAMLMTSGPSSGHTSAHNSMVAVAVSLVAYSFMSAVFVLGESSSYQAAVCIVTLNGRRGKTLSSFLPGDKSQNVTCRARCIHRLCCIR